MTILINFENEKSVRDKAIIARLIDIRKAQQEYRSLHQGAYTDNFDSLIAFVKTAKLPFIMKVGSLTDDQLNNGMTEKKAMAIITIMNINTKVNLKMSTELDLLFIIAVVHSTARNLISMQVNGQEISSVQRV